ncbi:MAG: TIGR01777 family oxidoreductase [Oligoflexia bacterium]|nr:TIGR01777 family oxidoreductase [Oligoflexia bacterium]
MRVLVTGATGFIGRELCKKIVSEGHELVALMRNPVRARDLLPPPYDAYAWDMLKGPPFEQALHGVDAIFHLAGDSVGEGRWTRARREAILSSRVEGTRNLIEGLRRQKGPRPQVLVSASAIGFYGDRGEELLTEEATPGGGFLSEVCVKWEREAAKAAELGMRVVSVRLGMVLGPEGGALERILPIFRSGWGGRLASGRQWMSWIHLADAVGLLEYAARIPEARGPLNAVAPHPVTNAEFTRCLSEVLGRNARLPVPRLALQLALGRAAELVLSSQKVSSRRARELGFGFRFERLEAALKDVLTPLP